MPSYFVYGLNIQSEIMLPQHLEGGETADAIVRYGPVALGPSDIGNHDWNLNGERHEVNIFWKEVGGFCIRNGNEIVMDPLPGVDQRLIRLIVLGSAMGILLSQGDSMIFHSSVVEFQSGCAAFMASSGYGKSTTAAALYARGHALVADDIMALDSTSNGFRARPGYPQMKLWPDAAEAVGEDAVRLTRLHPDYEKLARPVKENFARAPVPLKGVFVLDVGESVEIEQLKGPNALMGLLPHWYGAQFEGELLKIFGLEAHFKACNALASKVPIYKLNRPLSLNCLDEVALAVEQQLSEG